MTIPISGFFVEAGSTADIVAIFKDEDGELTSPDGTPTITIWDSEGVKQEDASAMTLESTATFVFFFTTPSTPKGTYKAQVSADVDTSGNTRTEKQSTRFEVV